MKYFNFFWFCQVLAQNSGYDPQETLVKVQAEYAESGQLVGVDLNTGKGAKNTTVDYDQSQIAQLRYLCHWVTVDPCVFKKNPTSCKR